MWLEFVWKFEIFWFLKIGAGIRNLWCFLFIDFIVFFSQPEYRYNIDNETRGKLGHGSRTRVKKKGPIKGPTYIYDINNEGNILRGWVMVTLEGWFSGKGKNLKEKWRPFFSSAACKTVSHSTLKNRFEYASAYLYNFCDDVSPVMTSLRFTRSLNVLNEVKRNHLLPKSVVSPCKLSPFSYNNRFSVIDNVRDFSLPQLLTFFIFGLIFDASVSCCWVSIYSRWGWWSWR